MLILITYYFINKIETKNIRSGQISKEEKTFKFFCNFFYSGCDTTNFNVFLVIKWANRNQGMHPNIFAEKEIIVQLLLHWQKS